MFIKQNDFIILNGETEPRKVLAIEYHYSGDYYLVEGVSRQMSSFAIDFDKTSQYQREVNLNYILDGCHRI
jgi:hypothetical protein